MWGSRNGITEADVERRISKGFGQGFGAAYIPWIQKHDFGSIGTAKELYGIKILRPYHLLSQLEYKVYLKFEPDKKYIDIREQFPLLDRALVVRIAEQMGCRIPYYFGTRTVYVMSTDFLLTEIMLSGQRLLAYAVKPSYLLKHPRVLELLEIERRYWNKYDVEWRLITERQIGYYFWRNLRWLRQHAVLDNTLSNPSLNDAFLYALAHANCSRARLKDVLSLVGQYIEQPAESSVSLFKHNTWYGNIDVDLSHRLELYGQIPHMKVFLH